MAETVLGMASIKSPEEGCLMEALIIDALDCCIEQHKYQYNEGEKSEYRSHYTPS
jgi:hypothetical protein